MALKKSELYSSLWQSCDELRGGMDASQYKDYVLVLLFIKYISDKYANVRAYATRNDFAITEEVTISGNHERRPDLVLYVNGIAPAPKTQSRAQPENFLNHINHFRNPTPGSPIFVC
jgi:type I restriction-modification system DNA methylase subunit